MNHYCQYSLEEDGMCDARGAVDCAKRKCKGEENETKTGTKEADNPNG